MNRTAGWALVVGVGVACAGPRPDPSVESGAAVAAPDTIVGIVTEVGPDPMSWMSLRSAVGQPLRLAGPGAAALRSVSGAEVWVSGGRDSSGFRVDVFEVRRVNDQPVDDGILVVAPSGVTIRMRSGAVRDVPNAPLAMRQSDGQRVWVSRPIAGVAPSYGVIRAR